MLSNGEYKTMSAKYIDSNIEIPKQEQEKGRENIVSNILNSIMIVKAI